MAYRRGLVFYFNTKEDTGLDEVPLGYKCIVREDSTEFILGDKTGIISTTTVQDAIDSNLTSLTKGFGVGVPGELGFGVGVALSKPITLTGMFGYTEASHDNFGNYKTSNGSVFVFIPKFYYKWDINNLLISDNDESGTYALHRAFINAGVEKDGFFISKYGCSNETNIAVSKPGLDPISTHGDHNPISNLSTVTENIYASAILAAKDFGPEYHCSSIFQMNALAFLAYAQGKAITNCAFSTVAPYLPKGCNNNALADVNDTSLTFTASGYSNCALTGSGSILAKTTHNGQNCGVADVNGNMYTIAIGLTRSGTTATDTADSGTIDDFYVLKESADINDLTMNWTAGASTSNTAFGDTAFMDGVDSPYKKFTSLQTTLGVTEYFGSGSNQVFAMSTDRNSNDYINSSCGLPNDTGSDATGTTEFGNDYFHLDDQNNMVPIVGGHWSSATDAGVFNSNLNNNRTNSNTNVGFRDTLNKLSLAL